MQVRMKDNSELEFYSGKFCVHAILEELKMAKAMKKKVTFYRLKEGTTFKYQRKVYIKSDYDIGVQLTGRDKGEQLLLMIIVTYEREG